ncbi:hypothetical protein [Legionella cardiaca]|uniref:Uncharacterized protein n=1 Tax=Legionella cardiaca TaxID=1071983 RepID=A0ABY8ATL9_9GAMM|nr:hypothetical protein [Legionella cardiaca]WED44014.1 hypothetical protein PXX05_04305 [Legionella cardiaca]
MRAGEYYAGGLNLQFFQNYEFEEPAINNSSENAAIIARNALRILMMGWRHDWQQIISTKTLKAIFIQRDRELMQGMRLAFQQGFHHIYEQLRENKNLTIEQRRQAELYISNCLTLLPYSDINPYESVAVPQWINGEWRLVDYKVTSIELTPTNGFKKLFINDEDRVFAYGLEPIADDEAEPHLIFMGTTYPAGQGFITQVNTDLEGFETVGNTLYRSGRPRILNWLNKQTKKIHCCGTSLGGSLSLLLAIDQGDKLSRVDALNPAGLYDSWFIRNHLDKWNELNDKPQVIIQKQGNDPVSRFGIWKPDWDVIHVIPPADKQGPNQFVDHALNYAGFAETQFIGIDTVIDNEEHRRRNFFLYTLARGIAYYCGLVPHRYLILPCWRYVSTHKIQLALIGALIVLFALLPMVIPGMVMPFLGLTAVLINAFVSGITLGFLIDKVFWFLLDNHRGENSSDLEKFLNWLLTQSSFILTAVSLLAVGIGVTAAFLFMGPLLIPSILFAVAGLTAVGYAAYIMSGVLNTVFGSENIAPAACHNPFLARNQSLDIYKNEQEMIFSLQELHEYYYAKRVLLKGKSLIPESNESGKDKFGGKSKKEILQTATTDEPTAAIKVKASKAKVYDMKQTVQLLRRIGLHSSPNKLKELLEENQENYTRGKACPAA